MRPLGFEFYLKWWAAEFIPLHMHEAAPFKPLQTRRKKTPTQLAKLWKKWNYHHLTGHFVCAFSCQISQSECNITNCLDVKLIHSPPFFSSTCSSIPPTHAAVRAPALHLTEREEGFLSVKGHGSAWLISYAHWACPDAQAPPLKRWNGFSSRGEGGAEGKEGVFADAECKSWGCMLINTGCHSVMQI